MYVSSKKPQETSLKSVLFRKLFKVISNILQILGLQPGFLKVFLDQKNIKSEQQCSKQNTIFGPGRKKCNVLYQMTKESSILKPFGKKPSLSEG